MVDIRDISPRETHGYGPRFLLASSFLARVALYRLKSSLFDIFEGSFAGVSAAAVRVRDMTKGEANVGRGALGGALFISKLTSWELSSAGPAEGGTGGHQTRIGGEHPFHGQLLTQHKHLPQMPRQKGKHSTRHCLDNCGSTNPKTIARHKREWQSSVHVKSTKFAARMSRLSSRARGVGGSSNLEGFTTTQNLRTTGQNLFL